GNRGLRRDACPLAPQRRPRSRVAAVRRGARRVRDGRGRRSARARGARARAGTRREDLRGGRRLRPLLRRKAHHRPRSDRARDGVQDGARRRGRRRGRDRLHQRTRDLDADRRLVRDADAQVRARRGERLQDARLRHERGDRTLPRGGRRDRGDVHRSLDPRRQAAADDQLRGRGSDLRSRLRAERGTRRRREGGRFEQLRLRRAQRLRRLHALRGVAPDRGRFPSVERWATFDCYGTLIDWNGGIGRELERLFGPTRSGEQLRAYHELEPQIQREDPSRSYREVMAVALARLGVPAAEQDALARSLPEWDPFPEVPAALEEARTRGWRLAVLSNTDRDLLDASLARIGVGFEQTIVASEIGSYKP